MRKIRFPQAFALAAAAAAVAVGVTQASAQGAALPHPARPAAAPSGHAVAGPMSLKWIRKAVAEGREQHARATARPDIPIGNFKACPTLPSGDQPANFLCVLIHIVGGELAMGNSVQVINRNILVPFAEGTDSSGNTVLLPGVLTASPMPVLGGIFLTPLANSATQSDPNLQLSVEPVGVGIALDPTGATAAIISQKIQAINPIFGKQCFVGTNHEPIVVDPTFGTTNPPPPNQPISGHIDAIQTIGHEIVILGTAVDNAFFAPGAESCGPVHSLTKIVDEVGGLPSPKGTNTAIFQVVVEAISYANI